MKIALLASGTVRSSLTARMVHLGRELVAQGHTVYLFTPSADKYNNFTRESFTQIDGVRIIRPFQFTTRSSTFNLLPYIPIALTQLLALRVDVVHLYKPTPITIMGLVAGLRKKTKVIADFDDLGSTVMRRMGLPAWMVRLTEWCEDMAAKHANGISVVSTFLRDMYKKRLPNKPIIWVPNGVQSILPERTSDQPRIIFIGSLDTRQIVEPLLRAMPNVVAATKPAYKLLRVIGDGTERAYLEQLVHDIGVDSYVEFLGWIAHDKLPQLTHDGDIGYCVVPNEDPYKAASTQKIFDYLALGVLPVVNNVGDLPTYAAHGTVGYMTTGAPAQTLIAALQDSSRPARAQRAKHHVAANYLWPDLAKRTADFYQQLRGTS